MAETKTTNRQLLAEDGWVSYSAVTPTLTTDDDPTYVLTFAGVDLTGLISVGQKIKITQTTDKFFIVTAIAFSTNTTLTVYGGTDYDIAATAGTPITAFWFSQMKAPFGFPVDPTKWQVVTTDTSIRVQNTPTQNTWYNLGSLSISVPIGAWHLGYKVALQVYEGAISEVKVEGTLSTANNSESDSEFTSVVMSGTAIPNPATVVGMGSVTKPVTVSSKTTYYLNARTIDGSRDAIYFRGDWIDTVIRAVCAYL